MELDELPAMAVVPSEGRGSLPFALVHGESLLVAASWAVGAAGLQLLDASVPWEQVREDGRDLVVHDPLCPLTPPAFLEQALAESRRSGAVVVGVRPVTDTVKQVAGVVDDALLVGKTLDRETLRCPASPVVLPGAVLQQLEEPPVGQLATLVAELSRRFPVRHLLAPSLGRRVGSQADVAVLAALSEVLRTAASDR
jgi:hypothetical protein